jgi:uncharacterized RDD family membrane protein YckC
MSAVEGPGPVTDAGSDRLETDALIDHPDLSRLTAVLRAPQDAIRSRLNAVAVDLILLGFASQLLAGAMSGAVSPATRAGIFLALEFAYFFVCELKDGQTIGKRLFHVRVTSANGAPATAGQVALRNVLRLVDSLPFLYASGLISMIRTGPGRRQRIGDVAAGTAVVLDPGGKPLRTPRWLLPTLTLLATVLSLAIVIPILHAAGSSGAGEAPAEGSWVAYGRTVSSIGYGNEGARSAAWTIARHCPAQGRCALSLIFQAPGEPAASATLAPAKGSWLAVFQPLTYQCGEAYGQPIYWEQRSIIALRFADGGRSAEGLERDLSQSPRCGYGAAERRWTAHLAAP